MVLSELKNVPDQRRAEWLTGRLRRNGHLPRGEVVSVCIKAAHKHHYALNVTYAAEEPDTLPQDYILKWYSGDYPYGPGEGIFFGRIAPAMVDPPVPACYDVEIGQESGRTHILLEDLSATHFTAPFPYDDLTIETFKQVMSVHLEMHARWWDHPRIAQDDILRIGGLGVAHEAISPDTIRANERYFAEEILPARAAHWEASFKAERQQLCEQAIAAWADLFIKRTERGTGLTLLQGDAQLGNMLLPRDPQRNRPVIIDWEGCTRGLGVWDLARTMIQTELPPDRRKAIEDILLSCYHAQLVERGIRNYSLHDCLDDYRLSVLANIPHALSWESESYLASAMRAFQDWACDKLPV